MKRKIDFSDYQPLTLQKYPYVRSRRLLDSSQGQLCAFGFPGCKHDAHTTVAAHANYDFTGKGAGIKSSDVYSVDACYFCHGVYDGRATSEFTDEQKQWYFWRAFVKTTNRRIEQGLIKVEGA